MSNETQDYGELLNTLHWRDEILQVLYWMTGEGFGREFGADDLQKFLYAGCEVLNENLELMVAEGFLERTTEKRYALTALGRSEGGRRFADEFDAMLKPGHFECDDPDCDCHNPASAGDACKNLSPAHSTHHHS